jgi:rare lipoprotein A
MARTCPIRRLAGLLAAASAVCAAAAGSAPARAELAAVHATLSTPNAASPARPKPDLSGRKRIGKASFYAMRFTGRPMADGRPMNPHGDNAASRTLPLGTIAKVTNLKTRQSAVVTIQDRGPYVKGRIVDLSPSTARKIGITRRIGVAEVEIEPIAVPLPDGSIRLGAAATGRRDEPG